jgi:hypothetical protein
MHCIGCAMANEESIEDGAKAHGLKDDDISKMIKEINTKIKTQDKRNK